MLNYESVFLIHVHLNYLKTKNKMGIKGDSLTQNAMLSAELLVEKLKSITGITAKKMFGGNGIFWEGKMFGIVDSKGQSFLKVNDSNQVAFEEKGSLKHGKMPYYAIPDDILSDEIALVNWAKKSIEIVK